MKKKFLLFDMDHTLFDFAASEKTALKKCFDAFEIPFYEEILAWYLAHNQILWSAYENGSIPREKIFECRFTDTFAHFNINGDGHAMEKAYRLALADGADLTEDALAVIQRLYKSHQLYIVTNGLASTQDKRLQDSGLAPYFKGTFVSETMGTQKPMLEYFTQCFACIPRFKKEEAIIIGDSLSSDIQGGNRAGIDSCWFNPSGAINETPYHPTYEIQKLSDLFQILDA